MWCTYLRALGLTKWEGQALKQVFISRQLRQNHSLERSQYWSIIKALVSKSCKDCLYFPPFTFAAVPPTSNALSHHMKANCTT